MAGDPGIRREGSTSPIYWRWPRSTRTGEPSAARAISSPGATFPGGQGARGQLSAPGRDHEARPERHEDGGAGEGRRRRQARMVRGRRSPSSLQGRKPSRSTATTSRTTANIPGSRRRATRASLASGSAGAHAGGLRGRAQGLQGRGGQRSQKLDIPVEALFSTLGRTAARGIETLVIGRADGRLDHGAVENVKNGDTKTYQSWEMPDEGMGYGLNDVARGALGHWIQIEGGKNQAVPIRGALHMEPGPKRRRRQAGTGGGSLIGTPPSPIRNARWKSCAPCILSIRASPAACTSSIRTPTRSIRSGRCNPNPYSKTRRYGDLSRIPKDPALFFFLFVVLFILKSGPCFRGLIHS